MNRILKSLQKPLVTLFLLCLFPMGALAQNVVKGTVNDEAGEPVIGATVKVSGSNAGSITDFDGKFSVQAGSNATLEISYVGYVPQKVKVAGQSDITVVLKEDAQMLNDVVVIGYGTMKKSDISGSVATVDREAMMKRAPVNIAQALQGAAAGVIVTQQDGSPDGRATVRIRGIATITGNADPLYVVDGVQVGTDASFLNPSDIERIEVLKDASATAIYGAAGANGVVMITTKHGAQGKVNIQVTADFGVQTLPYKLKVVGLDTLAGIIRTARANDGNVLVNPVWNESYDGKRNYIDWQDELTRAAIKQQYGISASGGNEKAQYSFSVGYLNNDGLIVNSNYNRLSARANVTVQANKWLKIGGDMNYVHSESHGSNAGFNNNGNLSSHRDLAYMTPTLDYIDPTSGNLVNVNLVNPDGTFGSGMWDTADGWEGNTMNSSNMYASQMEQAGKSRSNRTSVSAFADINFGYGFNLHSIGSYTHWGSDYDSFTGGRERYNLVNGVWTSIPILSENRYQFNLNQNQGSSMGVETYLTWKWNNEIHDITAMIGNSVSKSWGSYVGASATDFISKDNRDTTLGLQDDLKTGNGNFHAETRTISYYGRLVYNLLDRYIITGTVRRDGSSNFAASNRWGTFPSAAIAWRISEEPFMKNVEWISNLKLRAGWGQTGNAGNLSSRAIAALSSSGISYNFYSDPAQAGLHGNRFKHTGLYAPLVDTGLKWETNEQLNFGLDFGLLNGDLNVTLDYFIRTTKDLLLNQSVRPSTGYSSVYTNYGEIENRGLEFNVTYNKRLNKDWTIGATLNGSTLKNKVKKMGAPLPYTNDGSTNDGSNVGAVGAAAGFHWGNHSMSMEGESIGSFYGWQVEGIFQTEAEAAAARDSGLQPKAKAGDYKFRDLDGNGVINEQDMTILGDGFPKFNYGLNLNATYKDWDFSLYMYGVLGQKILSYSAMRLSNVFCSDDQTFPAILQDSYDDIWSPQNPGGTLSRLSIIDENYNMRVSDKWVKNGDFLRISNIQVGYTLPKSFSQKLTIERARVYVSVQNLALISGYAKYGDPEVGQGSVLCTGLDTGRYPMPRTFMMGLNVTF